MKKSIKVFDRLRGMTNAVTRYPVTILFLLAAAVIMAQSIQMETSHQKWILSCVIGAVLSACFQAAFERFFRKFTTLRYVFYGCSAVLTLLCFFMLGQVPEIGIEIAIRVTAILLALFFAFMLIPVISSRISFNDSFLIVFKSFFHSVFFAAILYGGISLILAAINILIFHVDEKAFSHVANIVFVLFAPLFFLSLIPVYPAGSENDSEQEQEEVVRTAASCPKFLEVLISYIIIPLASVYTIVLLLYIFKSMGHKFWENNLLEPLLVSYAITVIIVYILSSGLKNKVVLLYQKIFPKILIPIVLFQMIATVISLKNTGLTHISYYTILFGVFAVCSGCIMCMFTVQKNDFIAAFLIAFALISILPPVDAFTLSRLSQESQLKTELINNHMFENNAIEPNGSIPDESKKKIVYSVLYLDQMKYTEKIQWIPEGFIAYKDFYRTFGFHEYDTPEKQNHSIAVFVSQKEPTEIAGYDYLVHAQINSDESEEQKICDFTNAGQSYQLKKGKPNDYLDMILTDSNNQELLRFHTEDIYKRFQGFAMEKSEISNDEATFSVENDSVRISVTVQNANMNDSFGQMNFNADMFIMVDFK